MPFFAADKIALPTEAEALPGRAEPMPVAPRHAVHGSPMRPPWPDDVAEAMFGMGWGGLIGRGFGNGFPERVPFAYSDFILSTVGEELGLTPERTAEGIVRLAVARMTATVKEISVMRGLDLAAELRRHLGRGARRLRKPHAVAEQPV